MDMVTYLSEIKYAAENALLSVWQDRAEFLKLQIRVKSLNVATERGYESAEFIAMNAETPDDIAEATGRQWETYFGVDKERFHETQKLDTLESRIIIRKFSYESTCGSVFQYAKQGISLVHGNLTNCPVGRSIGSQSLKSVIWQARNQSIHWEDGVFKPPVVACFTALESDIDPKFGEYTKRNMSFDVMDLLGWTDFSKFESDMLSLK